VVSWTSLRAWLADLVRLQYGLTGANERRILVPVSERPSHVYVVYIRTTPERLWAAITTPEYTRAQHLSRVTWQIEPIGDACKLTVMHDQFAEGETRTFVKAGGGLPVILGNLKTVLETREPPVVTKISRPFGRAG
jgi:hypothetical protein